MSLLVCAQHVFFWPDVDLREFGETAVILAPGARTRLVGVEFADTVFDSSASPGESGDELPMTVNTVHRAILSGKWIPN